ncbi:MAG: hypothetical protein HY685_02300, partial [Chloroflexi bacterium]|nr:hypothetical protein [Chloroflexota bacterium]
KRVLAYSTVSQLGLMMLALGAAGLAGERDPVSGIFHLVTHGYFKALLFLTAGVALHAIGKHAATMEEVRGLGEKAPFATLSLAVGAVALGGVPPLSGFFSKEEVLAAPLSVGGALGVALFTAALAASFLSSLYMARLFFVVVPGKPGPEGQHLHDPPPAMSLPMTVLLLLAIGVGLPLAFGIGPFLGGGEYHLEPVLALLGTAVGLAGIVAGWALYSLRKPSAEKVAAYLGPLPRWAQEGFFFDRAYQAAIDRVALVAARFLMSFDRRVVNDLGVDGTGKTAVVTGRVLRPVQTGKAYNYALAIVAGLVLLTVVALFLR